MWTVTATIAISVFLLKQTSNRPVFPCLSRSYMMTPPQKRATTGRVTMSTLLTIRSHS